jgi:hypothetical protein
MASNCRFRPRRETSQMTEHIEILASELGIKTIDEHRATQRDRAVGYIRKLTFGRPAYEGYYKGRYLIVDAQKATTHGIRHAALAASSISSNFCDR